MWPSLLRRGDDCRSDGGIPWTRAIQASRRRRGACLHEPAAAEKAVIHLISLCGAPVKPAGMSARQRNWYVRTRAFRFRKMCRRATLIVLQKGGAGHRQPPEKEWSVRASASSTAASPEIRRRQIRMFSAHGRPKGGSRHGRYRHGLNLPLKGLFRPYQQIRREDTRPRWLRVSSGSAAGREGTAFMIPAI